MIQFSKLFHLDIDKFSHCLEIENYKLKIIYFL
jgi:hypothetical protein